MLEHVHAREAGRELVQVLLVAHLPVLDAEVAPLDAPVVPPLERRKPVRIATERQPFDVERPALGLLPPVLRRIPVRHDHRRRVPHLVEQRLRIREEHQVGVEVRDLRRIGVRVEHIETDGRCGGPAILDLRPRPLHRQQCRVVPLELAQRDDDEPRQAQAQEDLLGLFVHAEHMQAEVSPGALERAIENEPAGQVVDVEKRAKLTGQGHCARRILRLGLADRPNTASTWSSRPSAGSTNTGSSESTPNPQLCEVVEDLVEARRALVERHQRELCLDEHRAFEGRSGAAEHVQLASLHVHLQIESRLRELRVRRRGSRAAGRSPARGPRRRTPGRSPHGALTSRRARSSRSSPRC